MSGHLKNLSLAQAPAIDEIKLMVNKVFLYESHPQVGGSHYLLLHEFNL